MLVHVDLGAISEGKLMEADYMYSEGPSIATTSGPCTKM